METIRILLVEDDRRKAEAIIRVLCEVPTVTPDQILSVECAIDAKKAMMAEAFDLLLLDIQLPTRVGERPEVKGGLKLWQTIRGGSRYKRPAHIIGLTAFEETRQELSTVFEGENWLLVQYSDSSTGWRDQIIEKVEHIRAVRNQSEIDDASFLTAAVIVTAVEIEREAVRKLPYDWASDKSQRDGGGLYKGHFTQKNGDRGDVTLITAQQMGMPAAACLTLSAIAEFRPRYVIMAGLAAGVRGKVNLGDVMVADPSWDWGSGKLALEKGNRIFQPDPRPLRVPYDLVAMCQQVGADHSLLARIRSEWAADKPDTILQLHVGPMASGSSVVSDPSVVEGIAESSRKLIGVDLETYAVYYAGRSSPHPMPKVMSVKSACDFADEDKDDRFQSYAAYTSVSIVQVLLEQQLTF